MIFNDQRLACGFSRKPQNMSFVHGPTGGSLESRKDFLGALDIDYRSVVCLRQVHGDRVIRAGEGDRGKGALSQESALADADALITNVRGLPLAVFTADCLSIFLFDPQSLAIGIVHAGWRGTKAGIAAKTVELMKNEFSLDPKGLLAGFGPSIRKCCYSVGEEFTGDFGSFVSKRDGVFYLDLVRANQEQLFRAGIGPDKIGDCAICTFCSAGEFFSHRQDKQGCGRSISVIMLR